MSDTYPVWSVDRWVEVTLPVSGGEMVVVPNVSAVVYATSARDTVLLQRRDKPGEPVQGLLEVPGGRWRAGESPDEAIVREVAEETGVVVDAVAGAVSHRMFGAQTQTAGAAPAAVVVGRGGNYPSLHVVFECVGHGAPRGLPGEVADPRWWPVGEVRRLLDDDPSAFVGVTATILDMVLP